jgi:hypothetical protein
MGYFYSLGDLMIFLERHFLIKYIYPIFIFLYCLSLGTLIDREYPFLRIIAMGMSIPFVVYFFIEIKNQKRALIATLVGIFIFLWVFLSIRNILFADPEGVYLLFLGSAIVILTPIILLRSQNETKYLEISLFVFSSCVIAYAILHYLVIIGIIGIQYLFLGYEPFAFGRVSGILTNPLSLGPFLMLLINYILFCQKNPVSWLYLVISIVLVLLTGNRSSFALLLLTGIVYEFFSYKKVYRHLIYLAIAIGVIKILVPPRFYEFYISRGLEVFSILFGTREDISFNQRGDQNAENLSILFTDPLNFIFGTGYSPNVTDSDVVTFLTHYGVFFTLFFYGLIIAAILFIGIPKKNQTNYDSLRIFLILTTVQNLIGAIFVEGISAPVVSGYYFAFLGVAISLRIRSNQKQKMQAKLIQPASREFF